MKRLMIFIAFSGVVLVSCKKEASVTIIAKWNLVSDNITSGIGPNVKSKSYIGQPGDYYDFKNDGQVYIKEGNNLDTFSYLLYPGNKISITSFGWVINGVPTVADIITFSPNHVSIHVPNTNNPGGVYERTIDLVK